MDADSTPTKPPSLLEAFPAHHSTPSHAPLLEFFPAPHSPSLRRITIQIPRRHHPANRRHPLLRLLIAAGARAAELEVAVERLQRLEETLAIGLDHPPPPPRNRIGRREDAGRERLHDAVGILAIVKEQEVREQGVRGGVERVTPHGLA